MLMCYILLLITSNAVTLRQEKSMLYSRIVIFMMVYSFLILFDMNIAISDKGIGLYGGLFQTTSITQTFHLFLFGICAFILQLNAFYPRVLLFQQDSYIRTVDGRIELIEDTSIFYRIAHVLFDKAEQFKIMEYPLILLFIIIGAVFLISSADLVSIFLSIELQSYGLYLLSTIYRNSEASTSAGLTYFLLGGLASCFILLGTSLIYANTGTTNLDSFYILTSLSSITHESALVISKPYYINISLLIMSVGFLFKISAAPFHFWSPDVYDAIPTIVTTFVAIVAKISILVFFLELVHYTSYSFYPYDFTWKSSLLLSSLLSMLVGTILGLTQSRIKRLFAYSTISHLGFMLLALTINSLESIQAFVFYLMQYSVCNLNTFLILITIGLSFYPYVNISGQDKNLLDSYYSPIQLISQIKGYFYINPYLALCLAITLFSFVGIPPIVGFFAKQMVLSAALDSGYVFISLIAILTSVISAVYYLAVIKQIFFEKADYEANSSTVESLDITDEKADYEANSLNCLIEKLRGITDEKAYYEANSLNCLIEKSWGITDEKADYEANSLNWLIEKLRGIIDEELYRGEPLLAYRISTTLGIVLSDTLTITTSSFSLLLLLFIFTPQETLSMANVLSLTLFNC